MSTPAKLTKKQKKALAFRERKGKGKAKDFDEDNAVPVAEDEDSMGDQAPSGSVETLAEVAKVGERSKEALSKKRKRPGDDANEEKDKPEPKKKKKKDIENTANGEVAQDEKGEGAKKSASKQRYILFVGMCSSCTELVPSLMRYVGNLKYTTTKEAIQQHFAACGMFSLQYYATRPDTALQTHHQKFG